MLRDFDGHLRGFQENVLRGGSLSYATPAFIAAFGEDVARFFLETAANPYKCGLLDNVLAGSSMLRKHFTEAPRGAERVVMEVVSRSENTRWLSYVCGGVAEASYILPRQGVFGTLPVLLLHPVVLALLLYQQ